MAFWIVFVLHSSGKIEHLKILSFLKQLLVLMYLFIFVGLLKSNC